MMSNKSTNLLRPKSLKQPHSAKQPNTTSALYSGIASAERAIQQQRHSGLSFARRSTQLKYGRDLSTISARKHTDPPPTYHPWESECNKIRIREKNIKPMTKDPYTPISRLIAHAVERVTTETECCPPLIPAEAVQIQTFNVQKAPRPILPSMIHYVRRNEPMPSERLTLLSTAMKVSSLPQSQYQTPTISVVTTSKITSVAPTLPITDRLLNRAKIRNDPPIIRRPPRRLMINITHEAILPLSVCG